MTHAMKMLNHERDGLVYNATVKYRDKTYQRKELIEKFEKKVVNRTVTWKGDGETEPKELERVFNNKDLLQY